MSTPPSQIIEKLHFQYSLLLPLILFLIFFYKWLQTTTQATNPNCKLPPSPPKLPILGNLLQLGRFPHRSLYSLSNRYGGDLMLVHIGSKPTLVVSSAKAAEEIMKTHDVTFSNRPKSTAASIVLYDGRDIAFAKYGEYWRQMKSLCVLQLLSNKKVKSFQRVRSEEAGLMVEKIRRSAADDSVEAVDLSEILITGSNNVVCRTAFGKKYAGDQGGGSIDFRGLLKSFSEVFGSVCLGDIIPWLGWIDRVSGLERKARKVAEELDEFVEKIVQEHGLDKLNTEKCSDDGADPKEEKVLDFVDILLEAQRNDPAAVSTESIKAVVLDTLAAGTGTINTALEWTMTELLHHPGAMKELQREVREVVMRRNKGGRVNEDDLENMKYLKAVIKEALRLHPPLPLLVFREASQDVRVNGYHIAAKTQVIVNAWAIQRDPAVWEDPEEFRPERFLNSEMDFKGQDFELIPFGAGRRGCPGISYASVHVEYVLATLAHEFDWKLPEGVAERETSSVAEAFSTTVSRRDPLIAIPTIPIPAVKT